MHGESHLGCGRHRLAGPQMNAKGNRRTTSLWAAHGRTNHQTLPPAATVNRRSARLRPDDRDPCTPRGAGRSASTVRGFTDRAPYASDLRRHNLYTVLRHVFGTDVAEVGPRPAQQLGSPSAVRLAILCLQSTCTLSVTRRWPGIQLLPRPPRSAVVRPRCGQ